MTSSNPIATNQATPDAGPSSRSRDPTRGYRWGDLLALARPHRRWLLILNLIAIAGALAAVPIPLLMPILVDEVLLDQPGAAVTTMDRLFPVAWQGPVLYIGATLGLIVTLRLISLVLQVLQTRGFARIAKEMIYQVRRDLLLRLQRVSMAEYETLGSGTVASLLVTDLDAVDDFIGGALSRLLVAVLSIVGTAVILLWMHWQLGLFILLLNPVVIYLTLVLGRRVKAMKRRENAAYQAFQESLAETLDAIQQIRAGNREGFYIRRSIGTADRMRHFSAAFAWKSQAATRLSSLVFVVGLDLFRAISMLMVLFSDLSIGEMLAVYAYLWFMMGPVQEVLDIQYAFHAADAALRRVGRLTRMQREPDWPRLQDPFRGHRTVAIGVEGLRFAYGDGPEVLHGLGFELARGQRLAIVGASGSGKTTLVHLLLGLYPPLSGRIRFDGVPMEQIGMEVVREHVATVLQHPALFNDSLRMNLTLGRALDDGALWEALRVAQLDQVVAQLEDGLDSRIGRDGIRLSGGQRQRVAIARMVLADPKVVILDEATSALDSVTEGRLHAALARYLDGRTTLIVAHRLSAVRQADRILVLERGRIVEQGTHDALLARGGAYAALYAAQDDAA